MKKPIITFASVAAIILTAHAISDNFFSGYFCSLISFMLAIYINRPDLIADTFKGDRMTKEDILEHIKEYDKNM